ncbi:YeeE/YedE thiosulfate transporter family protein [Polynucleobacter sp. AP-Ainpum-60-G11]|uniref:YeeE/YedE thiosulfate transporter family protein n=1 Tax=Polynucleobacter sp. AP-Ainpum-60-G11 TaxID=2576926 RepID=UPI001BFD1456|nr:YeeE/YedE thiosulfate transporter family protein [Polynucleobacter sp. AP-Ainpum-60-G11]QWE25878.1 YeeE/YedE family protein [Polynucleobacter sp. AP-Ainpum-60-G11]
MNKQTQDKPAPYWNPLIAGILLGIVLLSTFVVTGHGLGATGFTTRLTAWFGMHLLPVATNANEYLGGMVEEGKPLDAWITWQVVGVAFGTLVSAFLAGRIAIKLDGKKFLGGSKRPVTALFGGILAGFGARIAAGCTSGLGLSGAAVLSLAGFTFLGAFFAVGLVASRFMKEEK